MQFGDASWSDKGDETAESCNAIGDGRPACDELGMKDGKFDAGTSASGLLCVNHECVVQPYGLHAAGSTTVDGKRPAAEVDKEIYAHGASVVEVQRKAGGNDMEMVRGSSTTAACTRPRRWTWAARPRATPSWSTSCRPAPKPSA